MNIKAKPIIDGKFWMVEDNGVKIGLLHKVEKNKYLISSKQGEAKLKKDDLVKTFGTDFFQVSNNIELKTKESREMYGFPTSCHPYNPVFDIRRKLPLFTKSPASKSLYCAGYYTIKFNKGWVRSFCPKLITIERYENKGPFRTEQELKQAMSNVKSD
jgi:hypothetical protein